MMTDIKKTANRVRAKLKGESCVNLNLSSVISAARWTR
ncbi:hypothetical protein E2C01_084420 [Portunus trituberculatus]|uniref:Uncharacterized protein n=1 Tax=Portunus trituberculatus TaxID=210409 RepID=A0A5B7J457_PORTR|nr:hypothetical protein [Portunus trituberculatus]